MPAVPCAARGLSAAEAIRVLKAEYAVERTGQLAARPSLLRVLKHLERGNRLIALMGEGCVSLYLDGFPDIALYAGMLLIYDYVGVTGHAEGNEHIVYLSLNARGRAKLAEGKDWWRSLSLPQRLAVIVTG